MNRIIIACAVLSVAAAAVLPEDAQAQIVDYFNNNNGTGNYNFRFETSNGLKRQENGVVFNQGQEDEYIQVQGSYSYIDSKGRLVNVIYRADRDGYHLQEKESSEDHKRVLSPSLTASLLG